ncbi:MAG TPA: hypothetical protein VGX96_06215 [Candidatus Elarobacter sp.]|jgi:hypothetical protein|nr:hypothetical protein [Candidatus Elarobacter sp.]
MSPALFSVDLDSQAAYVSYRPSAQIAQQVRVVRGRTGRLGAIPYGPALNGTPHLIAEYDASGEVVGVQLHGISAELIGLADEFLGLVDLALPETLARTILR